MVIALVVTPDGLPMAYEVLAGNTNSLLGWTAPRHRVPELVVVSPSKTGAVHDPV